MNTPTHGLINWTIARWWGAGSFPRKAVLLGSVAPDIPLYFLSIGGAIWFRYVEGLEPSDIGRHMYGYLFYNDAGWISAHNLLHSPTVLVFVLTVLWCRLKAKFWQSWWSWFFVSCLLHTAVDIPVHHDDGPLVFWPLNWSYRFESPISYWDTHHHGVEVMAFEAALAIVLLGLILLRWKRTRAKLESTLQ